MKDNLERLKQLGIEPIDDESLTARRSKGTWRDEKAPCRGGPCRL